MKSMSWFDQLFGEDDKSYSSQRSKRRKSEQQKSQIKSDLVPQSNDIYQRPRGKFRFPIHMYEQHREPTQDHTATAKQHKENVSQHTPHTLITDRKQRRHRGMHQQPSQASEQVSKQDNIQYSNNQRYHKNQHVGSQYTRHAKNHFPEKPNYHQKEFRASEVPSAIFGTKQHKKIENSGLKQPPGTRHAEDTHEASKVKSTSSSNKNETQSNSKAQNSQKGTPSGPRSNTVNIENIYASQIVEEIRREREKKVLQKKRFQEELKKKREHQANDTQNELQKAIDDMHSAQARQLLGEQYDTSIEDADDDVPTTAEDTPQLNVEETESQDQNHYYTYEEVDLAQFDEPSSASVETAEDLSVQQPRELQTSEETTDNTALEDYEDNFESEWHQENENDAMDSNATDMSNASDNEDIEENENTVASFEDKDVKAKDTVQLEPVLKPELHRDKTNESNHVEVQKTTDSNDEESQSNDDKVNATTDKKQTKPTITPIRKGSKPFNVVMTPSDKKRIMDRQKKIQQFNPSHNEVKDDRHQQSSQAEDAISNENTQGAVIADNPTQQTSVNEDLSTTSEQREVESSMTTVHNQNFVEDTQSTASKQEEKVVRRGPNLNLPSIALLDEPEIQERDEAWISEKKQELNDAFYYFNVPAEVVNVIEGPSVTRFELSVERGVKVSRITALQDDIKMALAAKDIRIEAPIPGTSLVGIEVPNQHATKVNLRSIIDTQVFKNAESKLTVAMGNRINNEPLLMDIAKTPHALIAGATGSGKSVSINSILISLLYRNHPEELKLLLIDPKMVELAPYNDLPHLVAPVITDVKAATQSLKWAVDEMERRYKLFAQAHVRNISAFNKKVSYDQRIPKIVIVIDELADLMMMAPQDVEQSIARLAQKARACGIHMLVATQRPSVNVITGLIKANIPTRIAFMVSSSVDSRTILDSGGAERLLGYGDMLYLGGGMNKPIRVQGTFVSDDEIDAVVDFIKSQREPEYLFQEQELLQKTEAPVKDELFDDVCAFMVRENHISTSLIQRHFQIGYNRAARIIDQLEQLGFISGANGSKPRDVYLTESELNEL